MDDRRNPTPARGDTAAAASGAARFIAGLFGVAFGGIGVAVLSFLWSEGDPPLVFRLVGSFIALVFVGFGAVALYGAITGRAAPGGTAQATPALPGVRAGSTPAAGDTAGYRCPNCGAPLGHGADVSPMGDVKCAFCKTWFNVHGRTTA